MPVFSAGPLTVFRRAAMASDFEIILNAEPESRTGAARTCFDEQHSGSALNVPPSPNDGVGSPGGSVLPPPHTQEHDIEDNGIKHRVLPQNMDAAASLDALDEVDRIENLLSLFRPHTIVSRINALAADMNICVGPDVFRWLALSQEITEQTEGAFDITCSPLWNLWGFSRRQGNIPTDAEIREAMTKIGPGHLLLHETEQSVSFDQPGVSVNFGGIGKGIAIDEAAKILKNAGIRNFMIQGGKSSALASGGRFGDIWSDGNQTGWTVGVIHPLHPGIRLAELYLKDRALGTSGSAQQFFRYKGKRYSHVIDPRSGKPAAGVLSTTVLAPTAALADALSTAFFVLGPEKTELYCQTHPDVQTLMILEEERHPGYRLFPVNLTPDIFRLLEPEEQKNE